MAHVALIAVGAPGRSPVPNRNSPPAVLLREGWREGKKTVKRTLADLTHWPAQKIEGLAATAAR